MRVLVVDDERDIRESLQEFFVDEGYVVDVAADGADALHQLAAVELPCVVILDMVMPVLSGIDVYKRMQDDPRLAGVPVIVSTSDPSCAPTGLLIMQKPINLELLLHAVRELSASAGSKSRTHASD